MLVMSVSGKDILEKMKRDELVLSMSLRVGMGNPSIEVASKLGFDYVYFDFEHGVLEVETFLLASAVLNLPTGFQSMMMRAGPSISSG